MTDERPRPGPSTRAIHAASRVPDVRQADGFGRAVAAPGEPVAGA